MDDPSQSAAQAAGRQNRAEQEKWRAKIQEGALTGLAERNTKWDVEYEGKDAVGTLVRPFEPGWGDSRRLPEKMLGETIAQAVARSMGRDMPHSGAGDGVHVFKHEFTDDRLSKMRANSAKNHSPPPATYHDLKEESKALEQQRRLEEQWSVGLTGGSYGMHTRHVTTVPPSPLGKKSIKATLGKESPVIASAHLLGVTPEAGPPVVSNKPNPSTPNKFKPVLPDQSFDLSSSYSREPMGRGKRDHTPPLRLRGDAGEKAVHVAQGSAAMLDRMGPNVASGPIPRDGFTTDAYENYTKAKLASMGYSDIRGEHGERPDELINGIDHLDKLEKLGKSAKDLKFTAGFTGNTNLLMGGAKVNIGRGAGAK